MGCASMQIQAAMIRNFPKGIKITIENIAASGGSSDRIYQAVTGI
jgi:hypothetical protein